MNEAVPLTQAIEPHTRPRRQVIPPNLIIPDSEPHKGQLIDQARDALELELLPPEVDILALVRARPGLVLALALVALVGDVAAAAAVRCVDVELYFDVGFEALGGFVVGREGDGLRGEECEGEGEGLEADLVGRRGVGEVGSVSYTKSITIWTRCGFMGAHVPWGFKT